MGMLRKKIQFEIVCRTPSSVLNVIHSKHIIIKMHLRLAKRFTFSSIHTRLGMNVSFTCSEDTLMKEISFYCA